MSKFLFAFAYMCVLSPWKRSEVCTEVAEIQTKGFWIFYPSLSFYDLKIFSSSLPSREERGTLSTHFWCLCQKLSLSPLYFNKTLLHKSSEWFSLSLALDWILLLRRPRTPASLCDSEKTFHLGGSSRILQDKVRMLGALVLCSPSEHVLRYTLLTLWCSCVNEWNALHEANEEPCSVVLRWPHKAYGRNLSGVYTDLPMPRGNQCLLRELTRNGWSVWTKLSFLSKLFGLLDHFITPWELEVLT